MADRYGQNITDTASPQHRLYQALCLAITGGIAKPGELLPPSRTLAQDRPFPTDAEHDRGAVRGESDPFGTEAKTPRPLQSRANVRPQYAPAEAEASAGSPQWMQPARLEAPPQLEYEEP